MLCVQNSATNDARRDAVLANHISKDKFRRLLVAKLDLGRYASNRHPSEAAVATGTPLNVAEGILDMTEHVQLHVPCMHPTLQACAQNQ